MRFIFSFELNVIQFLLILSFLQIQLEHDLIFEIMKSKIRVKYLNWLIHAHNLICL